MSRQFVNVTEEYDGNKFFTVLEGNIKRATPLLLVLAVIEISDVVFAVDSIPAVNSFLTGTTAQRLLHDIKRMHALQPITSSHTSATSQKRRYSQVKREKARENIELDAARVLVILLS